MKTSTEIITDLTKMGFKFRSTKPKTRYLEIFHENRWYEMADRNEKRLITAVMRSKLREIGYDSADLRGMMDAILAYTAQKSLK